MNEEGKGLWAAIHAKRKRIKAGSGERMRKPGEKGAPSPEALKRARSAALRKEEAPATSTASIPNPADTAMGPRLKTTTVTDRRRRKDQLPVLLKRFRKYIEND
jgi:hypothetical protein